MSIEKKNKDHLKAQASLHLYQTPTPQQDRDPLRFWTSHPTEKTLVDLHPFSDGELCNPHPVSPKAGQWSGPFSGRPQIILEIAPAIEARYSLNGARSVKGLLQALRAWWRIFDSFEKQQTNSNHFSNRLTSVTQLNELHGAYALRSKITPTNFSIFTTVINDARRLMRLPLLRWAIPQKKPVVRKLLPDDQARELKTALKKRWEAIRRAWARNDLICEEEWWRFDGNEPVDLGDEGERLLRNLVYYRRAQKQTGNPLPSGKDLTGKFQYHQQLIDRGLVFQDMRALVYPTAEEAETAYHLALLNSGWNPSTLSNLDAEMPFLITDHPKHEGQLVLSACEDIKTTLFSEKARARGKTQFCTALKKNHTSAPMIVADYLRRTHALREVLKKQYETAVAVLAQKQASGEQEGDVARQLKYTQELRKGCRSVWLYLGRYNQIGWIDGMHMRRYEHKDRAKPLTYLGLLVEEINQKRSEKGEPPIPPVNPSDFRDLYARWIYAQSGGNILAVMLALGHSRVSSTTGYLDNNLFRSENDEHARRFMKHLFAELGDGRVDLTILAQLVRHGPLSSEMEERLADYRRLMKSRVGIGCTDPRHPPESIAPNHVAGRLCGTHRCLKDCPNAKFLPESLDGIAMRVEELMVMFDQLPRETWLRGGFDTELQAGEYLLEALYEETSMKVAREKWRAAIVSGDHLIPGLGLITN